MTKQQIFNKVAKHLLKQGAKSISGIVCAYRGDNKTRCAIGCLIPNRLYDKTIEGIGASAFSSPVSKYTADDRTARRYRTARRIGRALKLYPSQSGLLDALQDVHDNKSVDDWESALEEIADKYELDAGVL